MRGYIESSPGLKGSNFRDKKKKKEDLECSTFMGHVTLSHNLSGFMSKVKSPN